ncbi:MAG: NADH-quinone oxidoreductase subunit NuoF [Bacteroidales bacterium]
MEKTKVIVGLGSCGIAAGAKKVYDKIEALQNAENLDIELKKTSCIGMCYREPLVEIVDENGSYLYGDIDEDSVIDIIEKHVNQHNPVKEYVVQTDLFETEDNEYTKDQVKIALRNCGYIDPESIDEYEAREGYRAIKKIVGQHMSRLDVIQSVLDSGLRGRGGGGFPTGLKWKFANNNKATEKYIICNADEGDPGAFMDRSLLEGDPHAVIEGMIIGAYAIEATGGIIYCRAEYPLAIKRLNIALKQSRERGFLGENILGMQGFDFDIYIKEGAGAFVCGEETALIASVEGHRGMPRKRPPFPAASGLWNKPTNINNVETFANIPWIILNGAEAYAKYGTEKSKGTKVFALAGKIRRSGLVEVPMGMSIRDVIFKLGGGIKDGKKFKAVQMGGPSGGCIPEYLADTIVDYDSVNATGAIMGSGGMVVMDETTCMVDVARFFLEFTQKESCGKCTFCRIGTKRMLEILQKITDGKGEEGDIEKLEVLAYKIKDNSLCGLGQTAPNPVLTTIKYFRDEYEAHIRDKKCPALVCTSLLTYEVDEEKCTGCTVCAKHCPVDAIAGERKKPHHIDQDVCIKCGMCYTKCKFDAIKLS